jgi:hypothetical protein
MEFFSENENRAGWSLYNADLKLVLEKDPDWTVLDSTADGKLNRSSSAAGWDASAWIDRILDVGHTNSSIPTSWFLTTLADGGVESGLNNVYLDGIVAIPEPATYGLITIFGGGLLLFRRRFKI